MMYKAKVAVCSEIHEKRSTQSEHHVEFLNVKPVGGCWWGNLRERDHWGNLDVVGRIRLRWICRKWEGIMGTGWSWLRIGTGGGHL
jgi:hypothetical protein